MTIKMYAYKDDLAGQFFPFGYYQNDALAARDFKEYCSKKGVAAEDLSLYRVASYSTMEGKVIDDFSMVCRGVKNE